MTDMVTEGWTMQDVLTMKHLEEKFDLNPEQIHRLRRKGLRSTLLAQGKYAFFVKDVIDWLIENSVALNKDSVEDISGDIE